MTKHQFEARFEKYRPGIFAIARALWASPIDAEEAVARVRLNLLRRVGDVRADGFLALWRTALQNDAISYLRKRKREVELAEAATLQQDAAMFADWGYSPTVLFALASLSEAERFVVLSHVQHGIALNKLANNLGVSEPVVRNIYRMARAKLAIELRDYALNYHRIHPIDIARTIEWATKVLRDDYKSISFEG